MCAEPMNNYDFNDIDGECPKCGANTVDGAAYDICCHSNVECEECGSSPCDGSC